MHSELTKKKTRAGMALRSLRPLLETKLLRLCARNNSDSERECRAEHAESAESCEPPQGRESRRPMVRTMS